MIARTCWRISKLQLNSMSVRAAGATWGRSVPETLLIRMAIVALMASTGPNALAQADHIDTCRTGVPRATIAACSELLRIVPEAPMPLHRRAAAYMAIGEHEKALADHATYLIRQPRDPIVRYERAQVFLDLAQYANAVEDFTIAIDVRPRWAAALNGRAWARFKLDDVAVAMSDVTAALNYEPDNVAALDTRAHLYERLGQRDLAIADFRRALLLEPTHPLAHISREGLRRLGAGQ